MLALAESSVASPTLALALGSGVLAQVLARHLRVPGIVLLLTLGVVLGPEVLGWVVPSQLGRGLYAVVDFAVAVILFEGGLNLELRRLKREGGPIRRLVVWGPLVTLGGATLASHFLLDWSWGLAFLFASLVTVTGPTVIFPLLRDMRLRARPKTVLEAEGVLVDPIGALLAVLVLEFVLEPFPSTVAQGTLGLIRRLGLGAVLGLAGGYVLGWLLRRKKLVPDGLQNIFSLGWVILLFQAGEHLASHSGVMAVTVAGVVVGNMQTRVDRDLREFKDQLTLLFVGLLFILLSADVRLDDVRALGAAGAVVVALLILVVRPLAVGLCTLGSDLSWRERVFVAWVGPRGIIAAAVAALSVAAMNERGVPGGDELRAMVFSTIGGTVVLAGATAGLVARLLGLRLPGRDRVAILGAEGLGLVLGRELKRAGVPVVFIDADPMPATRAREEGFDVVFGDGLTERALVRARAELVGAVVGLTRSETRNSLFVARARELFDVPEGYVALDELHLAAPPEHVAEHESRVLFEGPHDVDRWDVRVRHDDVEIEQLVFEPPPPPPEAGDEEGAAAEGTAKPSFPTGERFVILAVRRGERTFPMYMRFEPREGDRASVALYRPERESALEQLAGLGWKEPPPEPEPDTDAEVEEGEEAVEPTPSAEAG